MDKFEQGLKDYAEFEGISVEEARRMIVESWGKTGLRGYGIFTDDYTDALHIERIDELGFFENDIEAAKQAKKDGIKIIPWNEQPKKDDYKCYRFIDTPENRKILEREIKK